MLLLLQNRGRMTSRDLSRELEVARRTILRDVDALTEAGLPVVVRAGQRGGIELGFSYRTRLTGLDADEAEAMGLLLTRPSPEVDALGMGDAAKRARRKLFESLPDQVRERASAAADRFRYVPPGAQEADPRLPALALAVRERRVVRIRTQTPGQRVVHPIALTFLSRGWAIEDDLVSGERLDVETCGDINISACRFSPRTNVPRDR